jgi:ERCC4-related helicase
MSKVPARAFGSMSGAGRSGFIPAAKTDCLRTAFLIATSAGEVGIDIDANHMICDLVSWERMVQRLGRVNRRGGDSRFAMVDVIFDTSQMPKEPKPLNENASQKENNRNAMTVLATRPVNRRRPAWSRATQGAADDASAADFVISRI